MFNRVLLKFCFLVIRMCWIFLDSPETKFFFPYYPFFSKILGPPFHLGALGNCLTRLLEGPTLVIYYEGGRKDKAKTDSTINQN